MSEAIDKYEADRRAKLAKITELGLDPWGQRFTGRQFIGPVREQWVEGTEHGQGPKVRVAGRVMGKRITESLIVELIDMLGPQPDPSAPAPLPADGARRDARKRKVGGHEIDFTPPWVRKTYAELFEQFTGAKIDDAAAVEAAAKRRGIETGDKHPDVIVSELFEHAVEDRLTGPVFVIDYPASLWPLTKRKRGNDRVAERFELFIAGMEVANAYTESNDPLLQEQLFRKQIAGLPEEESMAKMDEDFIRALKHGMPPAGGLGIGIDRLVMLLTNSPSIRDVILFPLLRPEGVAASVP